MNTLASLLRPVEVVAVAVVGILFFFLIIGVFGMRAAIIGLFVFILGAILTARMAPGGRTLHET